MKSDEVDRDREAVLVVSIRQAPLLVRDSYEVLCRNESVAELIKLCPVANGKRDVYIGCEVRQSCANLRGLPGQFGKVV